MATFKVTACWYETVYVEAEDERDAIGKVNDEVHGMYHGMPDDYEIIQMDDDDEEEEED